jgi:glycosyltransferase involved in cell wall biosynthesis
MPALSASAALCTFNGARFLEPQVTSLFAQERTLDQIVAVDDASTDASFSLLESLAARSPVPMQVYRNPSTLGYVRNFERAISLTRGDVIFLCDQDDAWYPEKTRVCMELFEADPGAMLVHSDAHVVDAELRTLSDSLFATLRVSRAERRLEDEARSFELLLKRNIVTGATTVIRRSLFEHAAPFPAEWVHDEWLALMGSLMGKLVRIDRPLIKYRQHAANQIGADRRGPVWRLETLLASGGDYQRRQLLRMQRLYDRMLQMQPPPQRAALALVEKTLAHSAVRASLTHARPRRVPLILREMLNRCYFKYSRGWISIARDFVGPIDP